MNSEPTRNAENDVSTRGKRAKAPLFTAFVTVPCSTVVSLMLLVFCVATIGGALAAVGGLTYAVAAPFFAASTGIKVIFVQIGAGLTACGLGLIVFSAFLLLTRSSVTFFLRLFRYVCGR